MATAAAGAMSANAAAVFTSEASFLSAIQPGSYLNDFNDITVFGDLGASASYSGGSPTFAYTITAPPTGLFGVLPGGNGAMSTGSPGDNLTVTFTSGNVTAVGGLFFLTEEFGDTTPGSVTIALSDSTSYTYSSANFRGFVTSAGGPLITSLSIDSPGGINYPTMDHFYAGAAVPVTAPVPEPSTWLAGLGALGMLAVYSRRNRKA